MTSLKKILTATVAAATVAATFASTANAGDWNRRSYGYGYNHGPRHYAPAPRHNPYYGYGHQHRDRRGERIATGVAIGVGALILGSILASQANRHRGY